MLESLQKRRKGVTDWEMWRIVEGGLCVVIIYATRQAFAVVGFASLW